MSAAGSWYRHDEVLTTWTLSAAVRRRERPASRRRAQGFHHHRDRSVEGGIEPGVFRRLAFGGGAQRELTRADDHGSAGIERHGQPM